MKRKKPKCVFYFHFISIGNELPHIFRLKILVISLSYGIELYPSQNPKLHRDKLCIAVCKIHYPRLLLIQI